VGKEENILGSLCGGRGCSFVGKLKEAYFSLLPASYLRQTFRSFLFLQSWFPKLGVCLGFMGHEAARKPKQTPPKQQKNLK
jgi:hypothetical protein